MMRLGNNTTSTTTFVDLSQYTKSSSSCSTIPTTIDVIPQQPSTFDVIQILQQVWKGFCIPNNDASNNQHQDYDNDDECNDKNNNSIVHSQKLLPSTDAVPCCIGVDITSSSTATATTTQTNDPRHRLMSYELEPCSCCGVETMPLDNGNDAMISNDSFDDDDEHDNEHDQYHSRRPLDGTIEEEHEDVDDDVEENDDDESDVEYIIVPLPGPKQSDRIVKGLETFICAVLFLAITMYLVQKQQLQQQVSNYDCQQQVLSPHSFLSWHYKDSSKLQGAMTVPSSSSLHDSMIFFTFK